jgi:hypothetical protein
MTINAIGISFCYTSNVTMMDKNYCKINITNTRYNVPSNEFSYALHIMGGGGGGGGYLVFFQFKILIKCDGFVMSTFFHHFNLNS